MSAQAFSTEFPLVWEWGKSKSFDVATGSTQTMPSCHTCIHTPHSMDTYTAQPQPLQADIFLVIISGNISHCQGCSGKILREGDGKPLPPPDDLVMHH